jgi:hypothetical protein
MNLSHVSASGNISSEIDMASSQYQMGIGGLVGTSQGAMIQNATSSGVVSFTNNAKLNNAGGLIGTSINDTISDSSSTSVVTGYQGVGGFIGRANNSTLKNVFATGQVTGTYRNVGGLIGDNNAFAIDIAYATGDVQGDSRVGGLVGDSITGMSTLSNVMQPGMSLLRMVMQVD